MVTIPLRRGRNIVLTNSGRIQLSPIVPAGGSAHQCSLNMEG